MDSQAGARKERENMDREIFLSFRQRKAKSDMCRRKSSFPEECQNVVS